MKTILLSVLLVAVSVLTARAEFVSAEVGIDGMTCSMCSKGTEVTLKKLPFIDSIWVDLNDLVAHITFKKDATVSIDEIRAMVEDAGFSVRSINAVFRFEHLTIGKDYHYVYNGDTYHFIGAPKETLSGPVTLRFVDKPYVSKKEFLELAKKTDLHCYKKSSSASCCTGEYSVTGKLYHVAI